nr:hypothetical protein [Helicobacter sp. L8]
MERLDSSVVIYCDPPYYLMGRDFYGAFCTAKQHDNLAQYLKARVGVWLCSYDTHEHIKSLYTGCPSLELCWRYGSSKGKMGVEWLFSNLEFKQERTLWD